MTTATVCGPVNVNLLELHWNGRLLLLPLLQQAPLTPTSRLHRGLLDLFLRDAA